MAQIEEMENPPTKRFEFTFCMFEGVSVVCCRCIVVTLFASFGRVGQAHSNCKKQWHMVSSFSQRWLTRTRLDISGLVGCEVHVENQTRSSRASKDMEDRLGRRNKAGTIRLVGTGLMSLDM